MVSKNSEIFRRGVFTHPATIGVPGCRRTPGHDNLEQLLSGRITMPSELDRYGVAFEPLAVVPD